nr:ribonuclease H-like domain-containing protein [Tanacetum cinerariifolium]
MTLPDGYNNENKSKLCKLNKSLYGLKQALRQWNAKLTTALAKHGFEQSKFDHSLYTRYSDDKFIALFVYVDIVIAGNDDVVIKEFKLFLSTKFLIKDLDVNNAFLYGDLVEDVYMTLPDGYNNENKSKLCKLNKSLYGLKQALRQWNAKLTTALAKHGFEQSKFDHSLYTRYSDDKFIALFVYVDIVIAGNDDVVIKEFKLFLSTKFLIKDLAMSDPNWIEAINNEFEDFNRNNTWTICGLPVGRKPIGNVNNAFLYGDLVEYVYMTLPDGYNNENKSKLYWAKCPKTKRYVIGLCVFMGKTLVSWKSKKQPTISKSSSKAEYRSMSYASCEIDANSVFHERTKHLELDVHFVREKVLAGIIKTVKVSFDLQTADIFTKCLGVVQRILCCKNLGMLNVFAMWLVKIQRGRNIVQGKEMIKLISMREDVKICRRLILNTTGVRSDTLSKLYSLK